jgi:mitogen-activated protein kinase 1/3
METGADGLVWVNGHKWEIPARYTLQKVLGSGAYGLVCKAQDSEPSDPMFATCAIKRFEDVFISKTDALRILREISILRRLKVRIYILAPAHMQGL